MEDGEIPQQNVAAVLEGNGFVANPRLFRIAASGQSLAPDQPPAQDGYIFYSLAPDQAIVPMIVPEVLVRLPGLVGFR